MINKISNKTKDTLCFLFLTFGLVFAGFVLGFAVCQGFTIITKEKPAQIDKFYTKEETFCKRLNIKK